MGGSWDRGLLGRSIFLYFFGWGGGDGGGRGGYGLSHR